MNDTVRTTSMTVLNLCAPCGCACRYCLLESRKQAGGVDYCRGRRMAERFAAWTKQKGISMLYGIGYCAEYPELTDNIAFNIAAGWTAARLLQCNGIAIRTPEETDRFLERVWHAGIKKIDTTFFGNRDFHDAFACRQGDYDFMLLLAERAAAQGFICEPTVPVFRSNIHMLPGMLDRLEQIPGIGKVQFFLYDHRGRGAMMERERITVDDYQALPERVRKLMNMKKYKTEAGWLDSGPLPEYTTRHLFITLREDNIDMLERMSCDEIVAYVEKLDDDYHSAIPSVNELAAMYGDRTNMRLYRVRDLYWMWQRRYRSENGLELYDVTDERNCGAQRN